MLPDLPGWNSLPTVERYHSVAEIAGIVILAALVVAEVVAYQYGKRKDFLTEQQQHSTEQRHDEEIARVQHESAQMRERAAALEKEAAALNLKAVELQKKVGPRKLTEDDQLALAGELSRFDAIKYDLAAPRVMEPGAWIIFQLIQVFTKIGWQFQSYEGPLPDQPLEFLAARQLPGPPLDDAWDGKFRIGVETELIGLRITADPRYDPAMKAALALAKVLDAAGLSSSLMPLKTADLIEGRVVHFPVSEVVHIEIGTKP